MENGGVNCRVTRVGVGVIQTEMMTELEIKIEIETETKRELER